MVWDLFFFLLFLFAVFHLLFAALVTQFVQSIASEDGSDDGLEPTIVATSRFEAKLADLQRDIGTYCTNPSEEDVYAEFCKNFKIDSRENQVAALLAANAILQAQHTKLVPVVVSYEDFWKRYLFREIRLREREEERERLILKASVVVAGDDEMPWDDVDEDHEPQQQQVISPIAPHSSVVAPSPSAFDSSAIMLGDGWGDDDDDDDGDVDVITLTTPTVAVETKTQHNNTTSTNTTLESQNTTAVTEDSDWTGWE